MNHSGQLVSLFEEHRQTRRGVSSVFLSGVCHCLGAFLFWFALLHAPRIREPLITERYSVRHLDLHTSALSRANPNDRFYPHANTAKNGTKDAELDPPDSGFPEAPNALEADQTLLQPAFHTRATLARVPVPALVIWTPELATKHIVAPLPDRPASLEGKASLDAPNEELRPAERSLTAAPVDPKVPTPAAGTTSPLIAHTDSIVRMAPATSSSGPDQPTPTALLSISDLHMVDGSVVLPPVNQVHLAAESEVLGGNGFGSAPDDSSKAGGAEVGNAPAGADTGAVRSAQHIQLPHDGKFGVIVVGTSLAEEYPQTTQIWSDRIAYTAYLHVGLTKNWILQYAQLRSTDATTNGNVARLEAPWPYDILRPNLISSDLNADALMVHGILNEAGQLESLAVAFPQQFAQAPFVLQALEKWQFRPARQQGKPTAVEVLLIIPDELD
ncbi:hypothetical protein DYQ86_17990 [Acidobacteria bacterium AB60]|nr:hypothetical protein DYQ86_17990 [Acidobacteria bacterium AB60]